MKTRIFLMVAAAIGLTCGSWNTTTQAAPIVYDWSTVGGGAWTDTANWTGGVYASGLGNTATFRRDLASAGTVTLGSNLNIGNLAFGDTGAPYNGWTLSGSTLTLGIATGSTLPTITVDANTNATVTSNLAGTSGLIKDGNGALVLDGTNSALTYTGDTNINAGMLQLGAGENSVVLYNTSARTINVNSGGTLKLVDRNIFGAPSGSTLTKVVINGGTVTSSTGSNGTFNLLQDLTFKNGGVLEVTKAGYASPTYYLKGTVTVAAGTNTAASAITLASGGTGWIGIGTGTTTVGPATVFNVENVTGNSDADLTISAAIKDAAVPGGGLGAKSALTKTGDGTMVLSATNYYTGATTISAGVLSVATIGNSYVASNIGQASGGAGNLVFDGGTLRYTGLTASVSRNFTINNGKTAIIEITPSDTALTLSGTTSGPTTGGLTKIGAGTLTLSGVLANTGVTDVQAGTLSVSGGSAIVDTGVVNFSNSASTTPTLNLASSETIGSLASAGSNARVALGANTLTTGGINTSTTFAGVISGTGGLTKAGTGTLTLSGANSYTGTTTVDFGVLNVTGSLANNGPGSVVVETSQSVFNPNDPRIVRRVATGYDLKAASWGSSMKDGHFASTAELLDGNITADRDVSMAWLWRNTAEQTKEGGGLISDKLLLDGTGSDTYVLQMSYSDAALASIWGAGAIEDGVSLGWLDTRAGSATNGKWVNAVLGNTGGTATFVNGAYNAATDFVLGYYGVDTTNNVAWAVVNHNSEFAVVPEPCSLAMLASAVLGLIAYAWRKR